MYSILLNGTVNMLGFVLLLSCSLQEIQMKNLCESSARSDSIFQEGQFRIIISKIF